MGLTLPNLTKISLHTNFLTGKIPESISNASNLREISLEQNMLTGSIPTSFGNLRLLQCLHLFDNKLTNGGTNQELSFITSLTHCPNLNDFSVSFNALDGLLPRSVGNLSKTVERIYATDCGIKGRIPDEIGNLSSLVSLYLGNNELSGSLPARVGGLRGIQGLFLESNKIQGSLPLALCDLSHLSTLALSRNQISGPIPDCLGQVTSLRNLHLDSNRLNSTIPSAMWNLKDLSKLNLSSNSFTGDLPLQLQNPKAANLIDLSRNGFTGVIPDEYGSMVNLIIFSLAGNNLQGSIPESMGNMIGLERLDLSDNHLSGEIPKSLQGLTHLKYFNVSFNRLRGEIPTQGPFKNFTSYQFFESNEALCGAPELNVPLCGSASMKGSRRVIVIVSVVFGSLILATILVIIWIMRRPRKEEPPPQAADSFGSRFSYMQIQQATNGFSKDNLLGSGSFGSVYLACFDIECEMLSKLRHRNLAKVISACSNLDFKALLLEYMENGSLERWLHAEGRFLNLRRRLDVMIDVAAALEYRHHGFLKPVIHCDLKPSNILLDGDMVGHVSDFGITKLLRHEDSVVQTQTLATLGYMAPEYGSEGLVSTACDVYSYGILLMETFTGRKPSDDIFGGELSLRSWIQASFTTDSTIDQVVDCRLMEKVEEEEDEHKEEMKSSCVLSILALAMDCSVESPKERMNMKDVLAALNKIKLHLNSMRG